MKIDYSKPSADIALETGDWQRRDQETMQRQRKLSSQLAAAAARSACLLCGAGLSDAEAYCHRRVDYALCGNCGHLQTRNALPAGYPHALAGEAFEAVYPRLDKAAYASRRDRIYTPKLEWALSRMGEAGSSPAQALRESWLEVGCGGGYFLDALRSKGAVDFAGLDENEHLVAMANEVCGDGCARVTTDLVADLAASSAKNIAAFFVLEHLEEAERFWQVMREKSAGTVFLFAVPMLGFSTLLEGAVDGFAARNLDSVLHTQLYSDRSIDFALREAGYEKSAEWLFGQDASDLCRLLLNRIAAVSGDGMTVGLGEDLGRLVDPLQSAIDRARLCDARHILAVKR
jgi:SAM-dependent methyltransferase